jgi:hypothetical protein
MVKPVSVGGDGSMTKVYKSLGLESFYDWPVIIKTHAETATIPTFTNYEGTRYASMPRSKSPSTSNVKTVGVVESSAMVGFVEGVNPGELFDQLDVTFTSPVSTSLLLGEGVSVTRISGSGEFEGEVTEEVQNLIPIQKINKHTVRYSLNPIPGFATIFSPGDIIIHVANSSVHGDSLRDKYATIMLLNNSEQEAELYSVNLEVSGSKLDTSL